MKILEKLKKVTATTATFLLMFSSIFIGPTTAMAADTGWNNPANTHSPNEWNNASWGLTSNNWYASNLANGDRQGYNNFNLPNISSSATINGVEVRAEAYSDDNGGDCKLGVDLSWDNGSHWTTQKSVFLDESKQTETFGGSNDTWSRTWSYNDFTNSKFIIRLQAIDPGNGCDNSDYILVDSIQAKVHYTADTTSPNMGAITAQTSSTGLIITDSHWQTDRSPYFYWNTPSDASGIKGYWYAIDDSTPETGGTYTTNRNVQYPSNSLTNGKHVFYVRAEDNAGNKAGMVGEFNIWVDFTNPTSAAIIDNEYYGPTTYTTGVIKGIASDSVSGISDNTGSVKLLIRRSSDGHYWDGNSWEHSAHYVNASGTNNWSYDGLQSDYLTDGVTYTITPRVYDMAYNTADGTSDSFVWDNDVPVTTYEITPASPNGENSWYVGTAPVITLSTETDAVIFWQWDDEGWNSGSTDQHPAVTEGEKTLEFYSIDLASNEEDPHQTKVIKYDPTNPTITTPSDIILEANQLGGRIYTFDTLSTDTTSGIEYGSVCNHDSGDLLPVGVTHMVCFAADYAGNVDTGYFDVTITDTTKPVIDLLGNNPVTITMGGTYNESGALATDIVDGTFAATPSGSVNTNLVGSYTITYNATDSAGNTADPITRTINVVAAPVLPAPQVLTPTTTGSNTVTSPTTTTEEVAGVTTTGQELNEDQDSNNNYDEEVKGAEEENFGENWLETSVLGMARWIWLMLLLLLVVAFGYWWLVLGKKRRKK